MALRLSDLERGCEVDFVADGLGPARAKAFSGDFETWLSLGVERRSWRDGASLVRELLLTQCVRPDDGEAFGQASIEALDDSVLDDVADAFLEATGEYFRPRHIVTGNGRRNRVRRRGGSDVYDASKAAGEGGAARLLRVLSDVVHDRRDGYELLTQPSETIFSVMDGITGSTFDDALLQSRSVTDALSGRLGVPATSLLNAAASGRYGATAYDRALEAATGAGSLTRAQEVAMGLSSTGASALAAGLERGSRPSFGRLLTAPERALHSLLGNDHGASTLDRIEALTRHPYLGSAIDRFFEADRSAAAAAMAAAAGRVVTFPDGLGVSAVFDRGFSTPFADQSRLASILDRHFDLGVSDPFRSLLRAADAIHDFAAGRSVFPPGFQLTAAAGLHDAALEGPAAAILRHYGHRPEGAPVFAAAMSGATALDDVEVAGVAAQERLKELAALIAEALAHQRDPVVRRGFVELLTLLLTAVATAVGVWTAIGAMSAPTAADLQANTAEIRSLRADMDANERRRAEEDRRLRYVHKRAPLRAEPRPDAPIIGRLYPDQMVRVIEAKEAWLFVEVMDYGTDAVTRGWLNRAQARARPQR